MFILGFLGGDFADFLHIMLAGAITLLILDIFFCTEFLSWISLLIFATWGTWLTNAPWQWASLVFIAFLLFEVTLYYTLWSWCVRPTIIKIFLKNSPNEGVEEMRGKTGIVVGEGENLCVRCEDCIFPIDRSCHEKLVIGNEVIVDEIRNAKAYVHKQ